MITIETPSLLKSWAFKIGKSFWSQKILCYFLWCASRYWGLYWEKL